MQTIILLDPDAKTPHRFLILLRIVPFVILFFFPLSCLLASFTWQTVQKYSFKIAQ